MSPISSIAGDRAPRHAEAGFTLLEVLVALAILAISLGVILQVLGMTADRTGQAESLVRARLLAQSILARVGSETPVKAGDVNGEDGGLRWRLQQKAYGDASDSASWSAPVMEVTVEISWGERPFARSITISTLRLPGSAALR
jgi:general secretion pathway protein I